MIDLKYSELESRRFGMEIFRGNADMIDIDVFHDFFANNDPDALIVRIPVAEQHKMHQLNMLGREIICADTLVYYQVDLNKTEFKPVNTEDFVFEHAGRAHYEIVRRLVLEIFPNYTNHYFSNPKFDKNKITEGYMEWATNLLDLPGGLSVLIYQKGEPVGFILCSNNNNCAEIILNGVLPEHEGKGIYTQLVLYVKNYFKQMGTPFLKVSTQIQNFAVQKVWSREGLTLSDAFVTVHINK